MDINFFVIWTFISPFIILHLWLKNREYRDKAGQVLDHVNKVWDNDYKHLIQAYGTIENFLECHTKDFNILRSNLVTIYEHMSSINRTYMLETEKLLILMEEKRLTKKQIYDAIKMIRRQHCMSVDDELTQINAFIINEEEAHSEETRMIDILDRIDDKYKNNNIYTEVNKD